MFTIKLQKLKFFAFHGFHEEERILGNCYEVNVALSCELAERVSLLEHTIDYGTVYQIIKKRMSMPTPLLETLAQDLAKEIHGIDKRIKTISLSIEKANPPIAGIEGSVCVNYKKDFI
ncbi:MAG: dihydroneopterin aldolase [Chitinophagaceae bacterium]|nr:dihydroneopterin aldolase [Chitinophagaceae bacterium]